MNNFEQAIELLQEKKYPQLRQLLSEMEPADIAILLEEAEISDLPRLFRILPKDMASEVFVEMDGDKQELLIKSFSDNELKTVLDDMFLDDTVDIIEEMPANIVKRILKNSDTETRRMINEVLNYPKDSAGSIMTIEYVDLKANMTVDQAFERIRETALDKETVYTCYVTDQKRRLLGIVTVKDLLLAEKSQLVGDIMDTNIIYVNTHEDKEDVVHLIEKYDFLAMPVVDGENRLVGIITVDDAIDVMQEEAEEDFAKMAAIVPTDEDYFKTSVFSHAKHRILWLLILMLSATFTGIIITNYEEQLAGFWVAFIPMLMDTGGNCGSQASMMIIRGLAVGEIKLADFARVLFKEVRIALLVGVTLAAANAIRIFIMWKFVPSYASIDPVKAAVAVGCTLMGAVILAKVLGCTLPILAKSVKLDPALMASPLITTMVDAFTVLIYANIILYMDGLFI